MIQISVAYVIEHECLWKQMVPSVAVIEKNVEIYKGKRLREKDSSQRTHDVKRHHINVDATSIGVDTTSFWHQMPIGL